MKLLYAIFVSIVMSVFCFFVSYLFSYHLKDLETLKADYSMLYSKIAELESKIESMESLE